jgi:amino acid permease
LQHAQHVRPQKPEKGKLVIQWIIQKFTCRALPCSSLSQWQSSRNLDRDLSRGGRPIMPWAGTTSSSGFQLLAVATFGETEFWLALTKILSLTASFIFSIVYAAGGVHAEHGTLGVRYWHNHGAFFNGFNGVASVFVFCSTFYAKCEFVAVSATETRNPKMALPRAIRQVFLRIIFVYVGSAFFFALTCLLNVDPPVNGQSRALKSPMTIAIQNAG